MQKQVHAMIDLETLGLDRNAVVKSIGVLIFEYGTSIPVITGTFFKNVDPKSCKDIGLVCEEDTQKWWEEKERSEALLELDKDQKKIGEVIDDLFTFLEKHNPKKIWAKSPSFDCEKIKYCAKLLGKKVPWMFYQEMCVRTIESVFGLKNIDEKKIVEICNEIGVTALKHTPIYDCVAQLAIVNGMCSILDKK